MATGERWMASSDATARWLGESGELVSRYQAAVGEHVGRMATVNADLRRELAGARDEIGRLRAALALVLDEMGGCEGRQGMWEDGIDPDYRRAIEHGRAALKTGTEGASE